MGQDDGMCAAGAVLLGRYRVEQVIGSGGMGTILRVTEMKFGELRALKLLSPAMAAVPNVAARFRQEAHAAMKLRNEHVARVFDVDVLPDGTPYIELEYLDGHDLAHELERRGALPPGEAVDYVLQACDALAEAHALRIIHRDLKPANLFLTRRYDGTTLVKVIDFGIAKLALTPNGLTATDTVLGTPGYMAPEQIGAAGNVGPQADIWALGAVLYHCVNGHPPFPGDSQQALHRTLRAELAPMNAGIPRDLRTAILTCLESLPEKRFPSTAALAAAIVPYATDRRAAELIGERVARVAPGAGSWWLHASPRRGPDATTVHAGERAPSALARPRSRRVTVSLGVALGVVLGVALGVALVARTLTFARGPNTGARDGSMEPIASTARNDAAPPDAAAHVLIVLNSDAQVADAHVADAQVADAHVADAHVADAHVADARVADAHVADARVADAHVADARVADAWVADAWVADAAMTGCAAVVIEQLIVQAKIDRDHGAWAAGQATMERVLSCRRSLAYVELAAELACNAHDAVSARRYHQELPSSATNQKGQRRRERVEKVCRSAGVALP